MRMKLTLFVALTMAILVTGCAHDLTLVPRGGGNKGAGVAKELGQSVQIEINGKVYYGNYVFGGGSAVSGKGRILVTSPDGDAIRCEFQYDISGIGTCHDSSGKEYDLQIHN